MRDSRVLTGFLIAGLVLIMSLASFAVELPAMGSPEADLSNLEAVFKAANDAYGKGDFTKAAELYRQLYDEGYYNGNLLYNLGNTYFKLGSKGRAILYYERAKRLIPGDADLKANLSYALADVQEGVPDWKQDFLRFLTGIASIEQLAVAGSIWFFILTIFLMLWIIRPGPFQSMVTGNLKKWWLGMVLGCAIIFLSSVALGILTYWDQSRQHAVAIREDEVRFEPSSTATLYYHLDEGTRVLVLEEKEDWVKLKRIDGKRGWVKKDCLEII